MWKTCIRCARRYPVSQFHQDRQKSDGKSPYCKLCKNNKEAQYRNRNRDHINKLRRLATKNRTQAQRDRANKLHKQYLQKAIDDPVTHSGAAKRLIRPFLMTNYKRTGVKKTTQLSNMVDILYKKYIEYPYCPFTGVPLKLRTNMSLDHIKPVSRYPELLWDINNLQWTSKEYNYHKKDKTPQEFYEFCLKVIKAGPQPI